MALQAFMAARRHRLGEGVGTSLVERLTRERQLVLAVRWSVVNQGTAAPNGSRLTSAASDPVSPEERPALRHEIDVVEYVGTGTSLMTRSRRHCSPYGQDRPRTKLTAARLGEVSNIKHTGGRRWLVHDGRATRCTAATSQPTRLAPCGLASGWNSCQRDESGCGPRPRRVGVPFGVAAPNAQRDRRAGPGGVDRPDRESARRVTARCRGAAGAGRGMSPHRAPGVSTTPTGA